MAKDSADENKNWRTKDIELSQKKLLSNSYIFQQ